MNPFSFHLLSSFLQASYGHYKLVVTGHSLGAGTAVLLAYLLRQEFPSVRCIAFGVPASVLDERSAREVVPYVTSVVLGNDLVSRLNFQALVQLRNEVLEAIARAKVNKMVVMRTLFMHNIHPADLMHARGEEPDTPFKASLQSFKASNFPVLWLYVLPLRCFGIRV